VAAAVGGGGPNGTTVVDLAGANLKGANLGARLFGVNLAQANLTNANLTAASFYDKAQYTGPGPIFTAVRWAKTTCPDGTNSNNDGDDGGTGVNNLGASTRNSG
jgi:uncharacterized protein YjbI with pentapeptide repeats